MRTTRYNTKTVIDTLFATQCRCLLALLRQSLQDDAKMTQMSQMYCKLTERNEVNSHKNSKKNHGFYFSGIRMWHRLLTLVRPQAEALPVLARCVMDSYVLSWYWAAAELHWQDV